MTLVTFYHIVLENDEVKVWVVTNHHLSLPTGDTWSYKPLQVVGAGDGAALTTCTIPNS